MPATALVLATFAAGCIPAAWALAAARWPRRSPAAAIVLWQALGLGWGLAAVGALAGLGTADARAGVAGGALALADRIMQGRSLAAGILGLRLLLLLPVLMSFWFLFYMPRWRRQVRQRARSLRRWKLHPE